MADESPPRKTSTWVYLVCIVSFVSLLFKTVIMPQWPSPPKAPLPPTTADAAASSPTPTKPH
jgi:hypothetical protein